MDNAIRSRLIRAKSLLDKKDPAAYAEYYSIWQDDQKNATAFEGLALCFFYGIGVGKNDDTAVSYMEYSEKLGNANASRWITYIKNSKIASPAASGSSYTPLAQAPAAQPVAVPAQAASAPAANRTQPQAAYPMAAASGGSVGIAVMFCLSLFNLRIPFVSLMGTDLGRHNSGLGSLQIFNFNLFHKMVWTVIGSEGGLEAAFGGDEDAVVFCILALLGGLIYIGLVAVMIRTVFAIFSRKSDKVFKGIFLSSIFAVVILLFGLTEMLIFNSEMDGSGMKLTLSWMFYVALAVDVILIVLSKVMKKTGTTI